MVGGQLSVRRLRPALLIALGLPVCVPAMVALHGRSRGCSGH